MSVRLVSLFSSLGGLLLAPGSRSTDLRENRVSAVGAAYFQGEVLVQAMELWGMLVPADALASGSPGNYVAGEKSAVGVVQCMLLRVCAPSLQAVTIRCDVRPYGTVSMLLWS